MIIAQRTKKQGAAGSYSSQLAAYSLQLNKEDTMAAQKTLTDKPSGSWVIDQETGVWSPADDITRERYGKDATYQARVQTVQTAETGYPAETEEKGGKQ